MTFGLSSAKIIGVPEKRQIAINLKSGGQKYKTSVDDEILPALAERLGRFVSLAGYQFTITKLVSGGESVPAQTARVLPGTPNQTPPNFPSSASDPDIAQPLVRLAQRIDGGDAQNLDRLAAQALSALLAGEVPSWPAADSARASNV
jgi:hypothetical protein